MMNHLLQVFSRFTKNDQDFLQIQKKAEEKRVLLDERLKDLMKATLDHEGEWFLELVRKDPVCALNVVETCRGRK
jgi:hypothetical protein